MTPALDVVIVNHNTREDVLAAVASLGASHGVALSIAVVDNASTDGSPAAIRAAAPHVQVHALDRNLGFAAASNVGIRAGHAPLVLLLNPDTLVPAGALATLTARLEATAAAAAGPRLVDRHGRPEVSFGRMLSPVAELVQSVRVRLAASEAAMARRYVERLVAHERTVDWISGACLLVRREAAEAAGLLDERYFLYEEDVDFCAALRARGGRVLFTPNATVTHLRGRAMRATPAASRGHYDRSHLAFYLKHQPRWAPILRAWLGLRGRAIR